MYERECVSGVRGEVAGLGVSTHTHTHAPIRACTHVLMHSYSIHSYTHAPMTETYNFAGRDGGTLHQQVGHLGDSDQ